MRALAGSHPLVGGLACAGLALLAPAARAAGGEGESPMTLFWQGVNLLLLLGVLVYLARRPIQDFFRGRRAQVEGDLEAAATVLAQAEQRLAEWEGRAARLDAEVEEIKSVARQRAEAERAHIMAAAEASAERIRKDARAAVDREVSRARAELRAEVAALATRLAADLLERSVTEADQRRLLDEFVQHVASSGVHGRTV